MSLIPRQASVSGFSYDRISASIVETWLKSDSKSRPALEAIDNSVEFMESFQLSLFHETRHEVCKPDASLLRIERGRQHVRIALIALLCRELPRRRQLESASLLRVEQSCKHTGRVEPWCTVPVNGTVKSNERCTVHVSDDPVIADRLVTARGTQPIRQES